MPHTQTFSEPDYVPKTLRNDTESQGHAKFFGPYKEHFRALRYQDQGVVLEPMYLNLINCGHVVRIKLKY